MNIGGIWPRRVFWSPYQYYKKVGFSRLREIYQVWNTTFSLIYKKFTSIDFSGNFLFHITISILTGSHFLGKFVFGLWLPSSGIGLMRASKQAELLYFFQGSAVRDSRSQILCKFIPNFRFWNSITGFLGFNPSVPDAPNLRISAFEKRLHQTETS